MPFTPHMWWLVYSWKFANNGKLVSLFWFIRSGETGNGPNTFIYRSVPEFVCALHYLTTFKQNQVFHRGNKTVEIKASFSEALQRVLIKENLVPACGSSTDSKRDPGFSLSTGALHPVLGVVSIRHISCWWWGCSQQSWSSFPYNLINLARFP